MKLNNAQDAIKQAIEGGWNSEYKFSHISNDGYICFDRIRIRPNGAFLDPLFWQALGKARGWDKVPPHEVRDPAWGEVIGMWTFEDEWQKQAHNWFETRLANGDETKFWQSLP